MLPILAIAFKFRLCGRGNAKEIADSLMKIAARAGPNPTRSPTLIE